MKFSGFFCSFIAVAAFACTECAARTLVVEENGGAFRIKRSGKVLVSAVVADRGETGPSDVKTSFTENPDGSKIWNRWSEKSDGRFRLEVAERADGAVEISLLGQIDPGDRKHRRTLRLELPQSVLAGREFRYLGAERADTSAFRMKTGSFDSSFRRLVARYLAVDGVVYDFNPLGPGDSSGMVHPDDTGNQLNRNGVNALWTLERSTGGFSFSAGEEVRASWGGFTGAKIVIREGGFDDYHRLHLLRTYKYYRFLQHSHLLAFGSVKRGVKYDEGNVPYTLVSGRGWLVDNYGNRRIDVCGYKEGVYYSATAGESDDTYRFSGFPDGYYILTYSGGNYSGEIDTLFSLSLRCV